MVKLARPAWLVMAALLICGPALYAAEQIDFEDLLIDEEDKPKDLTEEEKALEEAQGYFKAFLGDCTDRNWKKASENIKKVLRMDLSTDNALKLRNMVPQKQIVDIFGNAPKLVLSQFNRLLKKAETRRREWIKDQKRIKGLIEQMLGDDHKQTWLAYRELASAGQYAAPQLVDILINKTDREARTRAALALKFCDRSATLPLAEALLNVDDHVRQDICMILSESPRDEEQIPDQRALPALKAVLQNKKINTATRREALRTIARTIDTPVEALPSAQQLYLMEAGKYYRRDVTIVEPSYRDHVIWSWDGKLVGRLVPECVYYLEVAEQYCRRALSIDPTFEQAKPLLICVLFAQYHTVDEVLAVAPESPKKLPEEFIKGLEARKSRLEKIINTLPSLGKKHFYAALQMATKDGQDSVAVSCVEVLKQLGAAKELPPATMAGQ